MPLTDVRFGTREQPWRADFDVRWRSGISFDQYSSLLWQHNLFIQTTKAVDLIMGSYADAADTLGDRYAV